VSIHDIVTHCDATLQGDTQITVSLNPAPDLSFTPPIGARAIQSERCYGDITLRVSKQSTNQNQTPMNGESHRLDTGLGNNSACEFCGTARLTDSLPDEKSQQLCGRFF